MVSPQKSKRTKYCANVRGGYYAASFQRYGLPTSIVSALVSASNHSLALSTWACYRTAENHLWRCQSDTGVRMRFPMTNRLLMRICLMFNGPFQFSLFWLYIIFNGTLIQLSFGFGIFCFLGVEKGTFGLLLDAHF